MKNQFETAGEIQDVDLLAAFVDLWRRRASGAVSFSRPGGSASFALAGGDVSSVSSLEARFESAAILVRAGKLDAAAIERLASAQGSDGALAALQAGILTKREWRWGEKIRAIEVLTDLLGWPDGKYYFDADARPSAGEFSVAIPRLLLELFLRSRDRNLVDHQLGASDSPLVRSPDFEREFATFGLTADAESVVRLIDGRATAEEISRAAPADEFAVRKLLAALTTLGLVHPESARRDAGPEHAQPAAASDSAGLSLSNPSPVGRVSDWPATELLLSATAGEEDAGGEPSEGREDFEPEGSFRHYDRESGASDAPFDPSIERLEEAAGRAPEPGLRPTSAFDFDPVPPTSLEAFALPDASGGQDPATPGARLGPATEDSGSAADHRLPPVSAIDPPPEAAEAGPGKLFGWLLVLLLVIVGTVLFFRSRPPSASRGGGGPTSTPTAAASAPEGSAALPAAPGSASTAAPVRAAPPAAKIAGSGPPASAPRPTSPAVPVPAPQSPASRSEWAARAARDKKRLAGEPRTRYAVQLELACEVPSLAQAWKHDRPAGSLWLLSTPHGSRECFRVLWGRYPNLEAARRAKSGIPSFFETGSNHPAIVSVR